jgi:hypothetical protein
MPNFAPSRQSDQTQGDRQSQPHWHSFEEILRRLHQEGIYIHADQLAEFFLAHGLPVDLRYVPAHLQQKAKLVNENYQGDMAQAVDEPEESVSMIFN